MATSKCEHPNHLLNVTCQSEFCLSFIQCVPQFLGPKLLKNVSVICHIKFQWKVTEHFWNNGIKKIWSVRIKIAPIEKNILKEKICRHLFVVYVLIYPLSKFGGSQTNSLWVLAFYSVCFKWKNWFKKTALKMSIRQVIYTPAKLKITNSLPIFNLFQWFLFTLEISFGSLLWMNNQNL